MQALWTSTLARQLVLTTRLFIREETMAGGPEMSGIEANVERGLNEATKVIVGTVATVKIAREVIEVIAKGNGPALTITFRFRFRFRACLPNCTVTSRSWNLKWFG